MEWSGDLGASVSSCSPFDPVRTLREEFSHLGWLVCLFVAFVSLSLATQQLVYELGLVFTHTLGRRCRWNKRISHVCDEESSSGLFYSSSTRLILQGAATLRVSFFLFYLNFFNFIPFFCCFLLQLTCSGGAVTALTQEDDVDLWLRRIAGYPLRKWPRQYSCSALLLR